MLWIKLLSLSTNWNCSFQATFDGHRLVYVVVVWRRPSLLEAAGRQGQEASVEPRHCSCSWQVQEIHVCKGNLLSRLEPRYLSVSNLTSVVAAVRQTKLPPGLFYELSSKFVCPFSTFDAVGVNVLKLDFPVDLKIHPVFHVSQSKPSIVSTTTDAKPTNLGPLSTGRQGDYHEGETICMLGKEYFWTLVAIQRTQTIRLHGRNLTETEHVKAGAYPHAPAGCYQRPCTITKKVWDALDLRRIREASDPATSADLAIILISEGLQHCVWWGSSTTLVKAKIEVNLPRKKGAAAAQYDKARDSFFKKVLNAVVDSVNWEVVRCLVIAGPGFTKDEFLEYLHEQAVKLDIRPLILNKQRILTAQAGSAFKHSISDVLTAPGIANQIKDTKAATEVRVLSQFMQTLEHEPAKAFYGPGHVKAAQELGAIQTLLLCDSLFRINDVAKRKKYAQLVEDVQAAGGTVLVFSDMHVSGEQLRNLTGLAAILRFPLPDLEDAEIVDEL
eukprot:jgi/Botrbrau1/16200/Bobra.160_1s0001.1